MNIELADPNLVRITWPPYSSEIEAEIERRLSTVPGREGRGRRCYCPAVQVYRLMELFGSASYDYSAMQAADRIARYFYESMIFMGIGLSLNDAGNVEAFGNTSPLIEQLVSDRSHALRRLVIEGAKNPSPQRQPYQPTPEDEAELGPLFRGIQNAKKKEEAKVQYPKRRRAKRAKEL